MTWRWSLLAAVCGAVAGCAAPTLPMAQHAGDHALRLLADPTRSIPPSAGALMDETREADLALKQAGGGVDGAAVAVALSEDIDGVLATTILPAAVRAAIDADLATIDGFAAVAGRSSAKP